MQRRTFVTSLAVALAAANVLPLASTGHVRAHGKPKTHIVHITGYTFAPDTL